MSTKKAGKSPEDELRPKYDLAKLGPGVRGKYLERALTASNIVVPEPDVARLFPNAVAGNEAFRLLGQVASKTAR